MSYLLAFFAVFLGWSALHILASERERSMRDAQARAAAENAARNAQKRLSEQPVVVS